MVLEKDRKSDILQKGLEMATHLSLEALTFGELAKEMKMSKSGLFAYFKSKENLQLEILNYAAENFAKEVIFQALKVERGLPRIKAFVNNWVKWGHKFGGGCIFVDATTEFNDRPGKVRDILVEQQNQWVGVLKKIGGSAIKSGDIKPDTDLEQFAFEFYSLVLGYYYYDQLITDPKIEHRIEKSLNQFLKAYSV